VTAPRSASWYIVMHDTSAASSSDDDDAASPALEPALERMATLRLMERLHRTSAVMRKSRMSITWRRCSRACFLKDDPCSGIHSYNAHV
jgi:hypothetical protein